jgi:hypothetical protein
MGVPVESTLDMWPLIPGLNGGNAWPCDDVGSVPPGDASGSGGGDMGYICEARREAGVEFWREREPEGLLVAFGRGEAGTELRSGAMVKASFCGKASTFKAVLVVEIVEALPASAYIRRSVVRYKVWLGCSGPKGV